MAWSTWAGYFDRHTRRLYQRFQWNFNWWQYWTTAGLPRSARSIPNTHTTFRNTWSLHFGGTVGQLGTTYCYSCARGGPAVRQDPYLAPWLGINGDDRKAIVPYIWFNWFRADGGRSRNFSFLAGDRLQDCGARHGGGVARLLAPDQRHSVAGSTTDTSSVTHYLFGHLEQKQLALTMRLTYPFSANMSLQVYASPSLRRGRSATCASCRRRPAQRTTRAAIRRTAIPRTRTTIGGFTSSSSLEWCSAGSTAGSLYA